jgi:hypothetical protein
MVWLYRVFSSLNYGLSNYHTSWTQILQLTKIYNVSINLLSGMDLLKFPKLSSLWSFEIDYFPRYPERWIGRLGTSLTVFPCLPWLLKDLELLSLEGSKPQRVDAQLMSYLDKGILTSLQVTKHLCRPNSYSS